MKTLHGHIILYDAECPLCKVYTQGFVSTGMLEKSGRKSYQQMPEQCCPLVDQQRAVNEIALVNTTTGEVKYGVESIFMILGNSFPLFRPLFACRPFAWLMKKLYAFISYNRRVIIPAAHHTDASVPGPSFRLQYRLLYLVFTIFATAAILKNYTPLFSAVLPQGPWYREYLVCSGQVVFQSVIISSIAKKKAWDYLGNMMTISFGGALLLLPFILISHYLQLPGTFYVGVFAVVVALMLLEHIRRCGLLQLGWSLTITWVIYRVVILMILL